MAFGPASSSTPYHCKFCNCWLANNKQSIALHNSGARHKQALSDAARDRKKAKMDKERSERDAMDEIRRMEEFAMGKQSMEGQSMEGQSMEGQSHSTVDAEGARDVWQRRKHERGAARKGYPDDSKGYPDGSKGGSKSEADSKATTEGSSAPPPPPASEGHYTIGGDTFLEGDHYPFLLKPETTVVECYVGEEGQGEWVEGLVAGVDSENLQGSDVLLKRYTFVYLEDGKDEETEIQVLRERDFRIKCGQDGAPKDVDEARLIRDGGVRVVNVEQPERGPVNSDTGVGEWSVIQERHVTDSRRKQEEAEIAERERSDESVRAEMRLKRKLEVEAENVMLLGTDSALSSYNVHGGTGYKGVQIGKDRQKNTNTNEIIKDPGKKVAFKKRKKKTN